MSSELFGLTPGSAEAREHGCICDPSPGPVHKVENMCPIHGLGELKALHDAGELSVHPTEERMELRKREP